MRFIPSSASDHLTRPVRLTRAAGILGGLAAAAAVIAPAQAATARPAVATAPAAVRLTPIPVNHANWTGTALFNSRRPAWYKDASGLVHLQGAVKQISTAPPGEDLIGTLQRPARPSHPITTVAHTFNGTYADVTVEPNGEIFVAPPSSPAVTDFTFLSLEGITYRPTGSGNRIPLNTFNWAENVLGTGKPVWYADRSGIIHLQGVAGQANDTGPGANVLGILPKAARPARTVYTIVATFNGTYADLAIEPNGRLALIDPRPPATKDYNLVSLASVSYRRSGAVRRLAVNTLNWSGNAKFNSRPPGWYIDGSGILHLQGAVRQVNNTGPGADLIGTLPKAARPARTVYVIVHTFNGTYADLAIEPNGQLALIDPRPPAVTDYTFVSLESITYRH